MNAQAAQTTKIMARRVNKNVAVVGKHLTITRIVNEYPNRVFGFAVTDDGTEVYIPSNIIRKEQMTEHDMGAGLTARVVEQDRYENGNQHPIVQLPLTWDGQAEEIEVETPVHDDTGSMDVMDDGPDLLAELAQKIDDFVTEQAIVLSASLDHIKALDVKKAVDSIQACRDELEGFRSVLDEYAPEDD